MGNTITISGEDYNVEMVRRELFDLCQEGKIPKEVYAKGVEMLRENRPLTNFLDQIAQELGAPSYDSAHPFGGLPELPEEEQRKPGATSETCYICRDPDFAAYGLPLCRACPACDGHVAADDTRCDDCGLIDQFFWEVYREAEADFDALREEAGL